MGKPKIQDYDYGSAKILRLTKLMSNYITLLTPPAELQADLQKFFAERSKYDELITSYNLTIQDLQQKTQQIPQLEQTIQQLRTQNMEFQNKIAGLETSLSSVSKSQSVKDLNVQLQAELQAKTQTNTQIDNELKSLKSSFEALSERTEVLSQNELEMGQLKNKVAGEWRKNQQLRQTLQNEREKIKILIEEKKGLEYALRRLERRLLKKGSSLRGLSIPVHHLEVSEDIVGKADAEIQEQIQNMNLELQKRLDRIKELEIRNNDLKERLAKSSTRDLQIEADRLRRELETKTGSIMGLESTRKKLIEQIEGFQQRVGDLQNKIMLQGKDIEEKNKMIKNLEIAVSSGVHDQQARDVIQNLQKQNREFRNEVRDGEKIIRLLENNIKFLQTQLKQQKEQSYKLYTQSRDQVILIQKLQSALKRGGSTAGIETIDSIKAVSSLLEEEGPSLDSEIRERDRKIKRLESYIESMKQEVEDLQFRMTSRDVKIDELNNVLKEIKADLASSKTKIIIRPPSTDEYRKTKVKI
ncbi:MAG: hypothetical protein HWN65_01445 [Candidatus Helarchaeota archaeon]|nr:hypothetical protein [Candidatus Helarchaeota archaeon]